MDLMDLRRQMMGVITGMGSGVNCVKGTFTVPDSGTSYTIQFGKEFQSYLFMIELSDDSKSTVLNSGSTYSRAYKYYGDYPGPEIDNGYETTCIYVARITPSTKVKSYGTRDNTICANNSITLSTVGIMESGWGSLVKGLTYKYLVVSLENI